MNVKKRVQRVEQRNFSIEMEISRSRVVEIKLGINWLDRSENTVGCTWTSNWQVCDIRSEWEVRIVR